MTPIPARITDWFTTMARIAGALDEIPTDRVIDGVDQSGLLLLGEGKGRRDFVFHYNRDTLEAVRKDQIKLNLKPRDPRFHFYEVYNLYHDPAEWSAVRRQVKVHSRQGWERRGAGSHPTAVTPLRRRLHQKFAL